jgi:hypothetical protein
MESVRSSLVFVIDIPDRAATDSVEKRFPTLDHVWLAAALSVVVIRALAWPIIPSDFWWQLAYGRWIVENGSIPAVDYFSYTRAGEPYFDQPWLAQILMYWIYRIGGAALSLVALASLLGLTYATVLRLCIRASCSVRLSAGLMILSLPVAMTNWSIRSQAFALPLFVAYIAVLSDWREGTRNRLWLLPLLMVAWVNLHGSFVLGGVLISLVLAGESIGVMLRSRRNGDRAPDLASLKPLLMWGAATGAAMLLNPSGPGVMRYVLGLVGNPAVQAIVEEWQAPAAGTIVGNLFFAYAAVVAAAALFGRHRPDAVDVLVLLAFFLLALGGERHVIWFALVSLPFLARQVASFGMTARGEGARQGRRALNLAFLGATGLAAVLALPPVKQHLSLPPELRGLVSADTPVETVAFMRDDERRPERLFHTETTGSYLMWAAREQKVFVDARVQLYPQQQLQDYLSLSAGMNVDRLLARYAIDGLLLDNARQARLLAWARRNPDWNVRFEEDCCTYIVRSASTGSGSSRR